MYFYLPIHEKKEEERPQLQIQIPPPEWYIRHLEKEDEKPTYVYEVDYNIRETEETDSSRGVIIIEM